LNHSWLDPDAGAMEDAALLRPENGSPLAFTVDFITPIVDDPEIFGAIAAANALSDIYAMGGNPQVALAICGFPQELISKETLTKIFRGGRDKAAEAGCAIAGGHTIMDPELKYGLCVLGSVPEGAGLNQTHARPGDRLILTKPLGFGIASQAIKEQKLPAKDQEIAIAAMLTLNLGAKDAALAAGARAATDVTGFGLLGHLHNLAAASGLAASICVDAVPTLDCVRGLAIAGHLPGGTKRNLQYIEPSTHFADGVSEVDRLILADAQTSGGLLIAISPDRQSQLLEELERHGTPAQAVIGELLPGAPGSIQVTPS
jgi:selenide,water dikinase